MTESEAEAHRHFGLKKRDPNVLRIVVYKSKTEKIDIVGLKISVMG